MESRVNTSYFAEYVRDDLITRPLFTSFNDNRMTSTNTLNVVDSLFVDDDGTPWMVYVKLDHGNKIWIAQLDRETLAVKPEAKRFLLEATEPWEISNPKCHVTEGPFIVKEGGLYYLSYSANDYRDPNYGIGVATSKRVTDFSE